MTRQLFPSTYQRDERRSYARQLCSLYQHIFPISTNGQRLPLSKRCAHIHMHRFLILPIPTRGDGYQQQTLCTRKVESTYSRYGTSQSPSICPWSKILQQGTRSSATSYLSIPAPKVTLESNAPFGEYLCNSYSPSTCEVLPTPGMTPTALLAQLRDGGAKNLSRKLLV